MGDKPARWRPWLVGVAPVLLFLDFAAWAIIHDLCFEPPRPWWVEAAPPALILGFPLAVWLCWADEGDDE